MSIKYYPDLIQGSDEWKAARCGLLTASEMKLIVTPSMKIADNDKKRGHFLELLAQRITEYVEPHYVSDDMLRGHEDEVEARILYAKHYATVLDMGFITNDKWGFTLGCSPDGLVGDDGMLECKSRRQKFQVDTILNHSMPEDYLLQVQTALLVSEREWTDFVSFSAGLPMITLRIYPDAKVQSAILEAAEAFEKQMRMKLALYQTITDLSLGLTTDLIPTERRTYEEITV